MFKAIVSNKVDEAIVSEKQPMPMDENSVSLDISFYQLQK